MPPKKVLFNANIDVKYIPSEGKGRRVPQRGRHIPTPPSLPRIAPSPPSTPRPPRPRPLKRYAGMNNLTKIQKGGAFTREMGKKLFLEKLTRASRPTVTKTSKAKKKPKQHRETK